MKKLKMTAQSMTFVSILVAVYVFLLQLFLSYVIIG